MDPSPQEFASADWSAIRAAYETECRAVVASMRA